MTSAELPLGLDEAAATILEAARRAWPREACGLLLGEGDRTAGVRLRGALETRNVAGPGRFTLDPADFLAKEGRARAEGLAVVGIWHSHATDGEPRARDAAPSALDRAGAWPGWLQVIAAVGPAGDALLRAYWPAGGAWCEVAA